MMCSRLRLHTLVLFTVFAAGIHTTASLEVASRGPLGVGTRATAMGLEPLPEVLIEQKSEFPFEPRWGGGGPQHGVRMSLFIVFMSGIIIGIALTISLQAVFNKAEKPQDEPQEPATKAALDAGAAVAAAASSDDMGFDIEHFWPRCSFLCLLLVVQSGSSILLEWFEPLLENYTSLVFYFTMLVGLGGNAGVQSVVISVRRFAMKQPVSIWEQSRIGIYLALVLAPLAFLRCFVQGTAISVCVVVGVAAAAITTMATGFGASLSVGLFSFGVDPAHASPAVQVMMDMIGLTIVCLVATLWVQVGWLTPAN
mmetsp:Transcript_90195/g.172836  ORF Transcript_90195/g.172836 Transcript_90195/m.172836 type:complete len:311 (-) Transcript_90195:25-957(-)